MGRGSLSVRRCRHVGVLLLRLRLRGEFLCLDCVEMGD